MRCHWPGRAMGMGMGAGMGKARQASGRAASEWAAMARFCHLIHITMGVSLHDGEGELIAPVTVSSALRLLGFFAAFLPSRQQP